jgi:hypothetical protein
MKSLFTAKHATSTFVPINSLVSSIGRTALFLVFFQKSQNIALYDATLKLPKISKIDPGGLGSGGLLLAPENGKPCAYASSASCFDAGNFFNPYTEKRNGISAAHEILTVNF